MSSDPKFPCDNHTVRISHLEDHQGKFEQLLEKIHNRLPTWATFIIGLLMGIIGWLIACVGSD